MTTFKIRIAFLVLCLLVSVPAYAANSDSGQEVELAGRNTVYWAPVEWETGRHPLILFSHGLHGCARQSTFLTEALAANGYWVFAPNHDDARCSNSSNQHARHAEPRIARPDSWDETSYVNRRDDIRELFDALRNDPQFQNRIDFSRVGLAGHSLGGYTVLGLAGAWPGWKMPGIKAVLALSPYSQPFNNKQTLGGVTAPVMFQGGTRDFGITPFLRKAGGSYDQAHAPKYYVEFRGAGHFSWTSMSRQYHEPMNAYSVAFFDHYVKGLRASRDLTSVLADVSDMRYDSDLGRNGATPSVKNGDSTVEDSSSGNLGHSRLGGKLRQRMQGDQAR